MFVRNCLRPTPFVVLVLVACFAGQAAQASTVFVGTCKLGIHFPTIQAAVTASPVGGTVDVCPGTYPEQVSITKNVTLIGIASGTSDAAVVVVPVGGLAQTGTDIYGDPVAAQILVVGANVTISHLTVDGSNNGLTGCGIDPIGIYYQNASGTITDNAVRNVLMAPGLQGCQVGLAINVEASSGAPAVTISKNSVRNYDKNGITASGNSPSAGGPSVTVTGNTVIGLGATNVTAQNGVQIGFGATGSVTLNYVVDNIYINPPCGGDSEPPCFGSSGILIYASSGVTASSNTVESAQLGIVPASDPISGNANGTIIKSNKIGGTQTFDAIDLCSDGNTAQSNTIFGSAQSAVHVDGECSPSTGSGNTVISNTINEACAGILLGTGTGNTTTPNTYMNVTNTTLAGDVCPVAGPRGNGQSGKQQSLRPSPYRFSK